MMGFIGLRASCFAACSVLVGLLGGASPAVETPPVTPEAVASAEKIAGLNFSGAERDSMLEGLAENLESYLKIRELAIGNAVPPALWFDPRPAGWRAPAKRNRLELSRAGHKTAPAERDALAFYSVRDLGELVRKRKVTSTELTEFFIARLKAYGPKLECVVTITEELALRQARRADEEIAAGRYRGPLHGIPYGVKDLFAVKGYKTTWGAEPYKDQVIDEDAAVVQRLEQAGAVLVAKLTLGALAWGDVWYGGTTRNPWDLEQGSSGSSAGSASATAAGLVPFAIGTETWGSIVSPSTRCGTTGLRPTYGRVSRAGAMALSWSMDKVGPICRSAEDCAIAFAAIHGPDGADPSVLELPFEYRSRVDLSRVRVGYTKALFDEDYANKQNDAATLGVLEKLGARLIPIDLPALPVGSLAFILSAEAAAAFDDLTRSGRDDLMVRQMKNAWPNVFRASRFIPAVEYIQANRVRTVLIEEMDKVMSDVDVYAAPSFGGDNLLLTNLTGHPCVVLPNGFDEKGRPASITFVGGLYDEGLLLAVAKAYQEASGHHDKHPPLFDHGAAGTTGGGGEGSAGSEGPTP
jgi:Asp-tRNA(Asn)/Glu-tRNA(Gln) amidotransferase A subunit family amidase